MSFIKSLLVFFLMFLTLFILFLIINVLLFYGYIYFTISIVVLFIILVLFLFKNKTYKKNKKDFIIGISAIIILVLYIQLYVNINYTKYNLNFLDKEITLISGKNINFIDIKEYELCITNKCNINELYLNDIQNVEKLLKGNIEIMWENESKKQLKQLFKKKELLIQNGYNLNTQISFNKENTLKNILRVQKISIQEGLKGLKINIFINKKQFLDYVDSYLYFSYNNIINNKLYLFEKSEFSIDDNFNNLKLFLNRKYTYKILLPSSEMTMLYYFDFLNNIEILIQQFNEIKS